MLSKDEIDISSLGRKKTALFVVVSDTDRSMDTFVNLFFTQAMNELSRHADEKCPNSTLPVPVRFILDDFATNCRIAEFPRMISSIRSRGISAMLMVQSEGQLEEGYGADGKTIISNCDTYIYLGGNDTATATAIAERSDLPLCDILNMPVEQVEGLSEAIINARKNVRYCKECFTLTDDELCPICKDASRNHKTIMVVENTRDLAAYEKTQKYDGVYHVLHGAISPMLGIGPNDIKLKELMQRLQQDVDEVIIATNSSLEGETTAMYISKLIKPTGIKVTRIASGVPVGGDLEYIDEVTLLRALEGRTEL